MAAPDLKRLGRYTIESTLGQGAMGVVYGATDSTLHRKVAIKTILKSALDPDTARQYSLRFMREAQAVARLNHPNIVQVHDFGEEGDVAYIVMEFIKGKELQDYFDAKQRFEVREAVRVMCELCDALQFAHDAGIIHRDVKPANVMIDAQGKVKLADFGVARITDADRTLTERTQAGTMIGTPAYMSPEQISGGEVDRRTDIFSAGIILYQFLTGERAFVGEGAWTIAKKIIQDHPPPPSSINSTISPLFDRVVNKALAKGVKERYQTARDLGAALRLALEGKTREENAGNAPAAAPAEAPRKAAPAPQVVPTNPGTQEVELEFWRAIKDGNDPEDFDLYVQQFPNGIYAELARRKIAKLRGTAVEENAQKAAALEKKALEDAARREAEARARLADEKARLEAQLAQKEAEIRKREAEAEARRQAEAKVRADEVARARAEAEALSARRAADDRERKAADENARRATEARAKYEAAERAKREQELAKREAELTQRMASVPSKRSYLLATIVGAVVVVAIGVGVFAWKRSDSSADAKRMAELVAQLEQYKQREAELKQAREQGAKLDQAAEQSRQREAEMQKQAEVARQREAEAKKAGDLAKQRELAELAAQREADAKKQAALTRQREAEAKTQAEVTRQREAEARKQSEATKKQQAELARLEAEQRKQADTSKVAAERAAAEKAAQAKAAAEKAAAEKAEAARQAAAQKQAETERLARLESERQAQSAAAERAAAEQRAAAEKAAAEKAAAEKAAAEKAKLASAAPAAPAGGGADTLYSQAQALENEKKYPEAVRAYIQAARAGSGQAAKKLGDIYGKGAPGVTIDSTESIKWYNFARLRGVDVGR